MNKSARLLLVFVIAFTPILAATPPQATVTAPNGGENLVQGKEYTITWNCSDCAGNANVMVEIFNTMHTGPGYHGQISPVGIPMHQGFFKWHVVGKLADGTFVKPGPGYRIHLEAIDGSDASDGTFSILKPLLPKIIVSRLDLSRMPDCPECVRIDLKPLLATFKNCQEIFHIALFANGEKAANLGSFSGQKRMNGFIDTRLSLPLQAQVQNRNGRFELHLFNAQGRLLQTQAVQVIL